MNVNGRYFINITPDHMHLYRVIKDNSKHLDGVNDTYKNILDTALTAANKLIRGDIYTYNHHELINEIVFDAFGTLVDQYIINEVDHLISSILNYYTFMLVELHINESLLYLDNINSRGIVITSYDNSHLESIMKEEIKNGFYTE